MSWCQKRKTNLDFTEARDSEWLWHQVGHMQACTSLQTDNHAITPPLSFFTGRMPFLPPNQQCQSTEGITNVKNVKTVGQSNLTKGTVTVAHTTFIVFIRRHHYAPYKVSWAHASPSHPQKTTSQLVQTVFAVLSGVPKTPTTEYKMCDVCSICQCMQ